MQTTKRRLSFRWALLCLLAIQITRLANGAEWTEVACVPADLSPEAMFDLVQSVDPFEEANLRWSPVIGGQNARCTLHHDLAVQRGTGGSLRVDYDFVGKKEYEYLQFGMPLEIPEPGLGFGFWMKHSGEAYPVRLRIVDKSGETHQYDLFSIATADWQFVAGGLDGHTTSWGGDANGRCDYPCRLVGIAVDRPKVGFVGKGSLWIDDVSLVRRRQQQRTLRIATPSTRFGNLYTVGEAIRLQIAGQGDEIVWQWNDYWGRTLAQGKEAGGSALVDFTLPQPGYYTCRIELYSEQRLGEVAQFCCAALQDGREAARSDFLGVCSHYGQNNYPLPSMDLMSAYGIDQFRDEISWRSYERQPGVYALPEHAAAYLQHAAELKMRPLIIYDYNNPLYDQDGFPNSPEAIAAFANYAVDLTRQTQGKVAMFEIWNEWIGGCGMSGRPGDHGPEAYGRLQKATYAAVKAAFPDVTVVGIGGEYGKDCAENIFSALKVAGPNSMDGWSIHPYRYPHPPEASDLNGEVARITKRVQSTGAQQKAWITEIGWPTHRTSGGSSEVRQARHCVRTAALLQSTGMVEKVFWYDFKDDGTRRDYNEHNFGLVRHQSYNCAPKPGVVAMSTFIRMTGGARFLDLQENGSRYVARYLQADGRDVLVAWSAADAQNVTLAGRVDQIVDIMGGDMKISDVEQLTLDPVYIIGRDVKIEGR